MKITFLLLTLCLTEIYANNRHIFMDCLREYVENYDTLFQDPKMTEEEVIRRITPYKFGCISACYLKKQWADYMPIKKYITYCLNETHPAFTDAEMATYRNEADRCIEEGKTDDCKLIECLKPWSSKTRIGILIGIPP